jgi:tetratricopeptide (TPR) repeat protein
LLPRAELSSADQRRVAKLERGITTLRKAGHLSEAREKAQTVVDICTLGVGARHWQTVQAQLQLQTLSRIAGLPAAGQADMQEAAKLQESAAALAQKGEASRAAPVFRRVLVLNRRWLGEDTWETARSLHDLALALDQAGRSGDAEPLHRADVWLRRQLLGPDHPATAQGYLRLGANLAAQKRFAEAIGLLRHAVFICEQTWGDQRLETVQALHALAVTCALLGKSAEAEDLWTRAAEALESVRTPGADARLEVIPGLHCPPLVGLAICRAGAGRFPEAWQALDMFLTPADGPE